MDQERANGKKQFPRGETAPGFPTTVRSTFTAIGSEVVARLLDAPGVRSRITLAQSMWRMTGLRTGIFAIALPVGAIAGAVGGVLVGRITHPHLLVLVMALLAGWSVGALGGGLTWVMWLLTGRGEKAP